MNSRSFTTSAIFSAMLLTGWVAEAAPGLLAIGSFSNTTDLSTQTGLLENGVDSNNTFGGVGSGLAWAGGNTFIAIPDRGPNATVWNAAVDNTTSYISRFETVTLNLTNVPSGSLPFTLTPSLTATTLLSSATALNYGSVVPSGNTANQFYFDGRSDNFGAGNSTNPTNARFDPEGVRVSNDGKSVFISDEYGPYIYQFDRATGVRLKTFTLPSDFAVSNLSAVGSTEISGNTSGRVANKGMEGLAITPDGTKLIGFMQSPLIQDGGDGGRANRIVTIDIATGVTHQYVYDNYLSDTNKNYNSSELLAINDHEFLVLERDGKGKGDGTYAVVKRLYKIDLNNAVDIGALNNGNGISGESNLLNYAVGKTLFLDLKTALNAGGITDPNVPAKLEGAAFGDDVTVGGVVTHTLYVANDNDFIPGTAGPSNVYVFGFSDSDLGGSTLQRQTISAVPEPSTWALIGCGGFLVGFCSYRRRCTRHFA